MSELDMIQVASEDVLDEILTELENGVAEPLYPGDERRIFGEVLASVIVAVYAKVNDACKQKLLRFARGDVLDDIGETRGCIRTEAVKAKTTVRFNLASQQSTDVVIPTGVRVTGDFEKYFVTTESATIESGSLYADAEAEAEEGGAEYNDISPGEISAIVDVSAVPLIDSVSNLAAPSGGVDEEGDDPYRERIREVENSYSTAGTAAGYKYWALSANVRVTDASVTSPSDGVVLITPLCEGGEIPDENVISDVLAVCSSDDVRPLTDHVRVEAPEEVQYDINISYVCEASKETDVVRAIEGDGGAIEQYIEWQREKLGRDINPDQLRKFALCPHEDGEETGLGVTRITVSAPNYAAVSQTQVAKHSGVIQVTHSVE